MKKHLLCILVLLLTAVTGAQAEDTYVVTFKANGKALTFEYSTLPKTFKCDHSLAYDELDIILKTLYGWTGPEFETHCDDESTPTSDDPSKVEAGVNDEDPYITISNTFEGTVTVTGKYIVEDEAQDYSLEISCLDPKSTGITYNVAFKANDKTVVKKVNYLPKTFFCDFKNPDGELDLIIRELYSLPHGYCHSSSKPVVEGSDNVVASAMIDNTYFTIIAPFEGTTTVSGKYHGYTESIWDGFIVDYSIAISVSSDVAIDETNFPDEKFRTYLLNQSYGADGKLTDDEIATVTIMNVFGKEIEDLKGIEYFTALKELYCYNNKLTTLDVSKNTALTKLYCHQNQIKGDDMDALVASLPTISSGNGSLRIKYFENEGNLMTTTQVTAAKAKNWKVYECVSATSFTSIWAEYAGSEPTAIEAVESDVLDSKNGSDIYFDLSGRRVTTPAKGIYVKNGRKVAIK